MGPAIVLVAALLALAPARHDSVVDADTTAIIMRALQLRLGANTEVTLDHAQIVVPPAGTVIDARLAPDARLGQVIQVRLGTAGTGGTVAWTGAATVRARIIVAHAHATHPIGRASHLGSADLVEARHEMTHGPLGTWPLADELVGGRVLRDLAEGACIGRTAVAAPRAVQNGQAVTAIARGNGVEVSAQLVAAGSGDAGAIIRVVNQDSRRVMKARIVSPGIVEIVQ